jgi:hypothetical protein
MSHVNQRHRRVEARGQDGGVRTRIVVPVRCIVLVCMRVDERRKVASFQQLGVEQHLKVRVVRAAVPRIRDVATILSQSTHVNGSETSAVRRAQEERTGRTHRKNTQEERTGRTHRKNTWEEHMGRTHGKNT